MLGSEFGFDKADSDSNHSPLRPCANCAEGFLPTLGTERPVEPICRTQNPETSTSVNIGPQVPTQGARVSAKRTPSLDAPVTETNDLEVCEYFRSLIT